MTIGNRVRRRDFLRVGLAVAGVGFIAGSGTPFGAPARVPRVGILTTASLEEGRRKPQRDAFIDGLRALGYVEGQSVFVESRSANDQAELLPNLAAELVRLPVDVIVTADQAITAAMAATKTVPIVFASSAAPVETGRAVAYTELNPVRAGLVVAPQLWRWPSAWHRDLGPGDREKG